MEENNIQKSGYIKEKQSVKYRLKKNVAYVTNLTSIAALVAIIALLTVSYTHLDVYKRQVCVDSLHRQNSWRWMPSLHQ